MFLPDGLKKLKRLFGVESSEGLQEQLASRSWPSNRAKKRFVACVRSCRP